MSMLFVMPLACLNMSAAASQALPFTEAPMPKPAGNDTFVKPCTEEPVSLDPAYDYEAAGMELLQNIYETLVTWDRNDSTALVPLLCTEVPTLANGRITPDGLEYTYTIKSQVKFHDNVTLTASDVEYSIERLLMMNSPYSQAWMLGEQLIPNYSQYSIPPQDLIDQSVTTSGNDVTFHLVKPYSGFNSIMTMTSASVVSKGFVMANGGVVRGEAFNPYLNNHTCGSGPFELVEWVTGSHWTLKRFDQYHGSASNLEFVIGELGKDYETRKAMVLEGRADGFEVQAGDVPYLSNLSEIDCYQIPFFSISCLGLNQEIVTGPLAIGDIPMDFFSDLNVRKAFAHSFDFEAYIREGALGAGILPNSPIPEGMFGYDPGVPSFDFNLNKSAMFLKHALDNRTTEPNDTYADNGFHIILYYSAGSRVNPVLKLLKEGLELLSGNTKLGVNGTILVDLNGLSWPDYLEARSDRWLPTCFFGWNADYPDPDDFVRPFCHQDDYFPQLVGLRNQSLTTMVEAAATVLNGAVRSQLYSEISESCYDSAYFIWTYQPVTFYAFRDWVMGYKGIPTDSGFIFKRMSFVHGLVPSEPLNLTAIAGDGQVELTWDQPVIMGNGTLTYHLFRDGSLIWSGSEEHYVDIGLINGHVYSYELSASNIAGWGSNTTEVVASPIAPSADEGDNTILYIGIGIATFAVVAGITLILMRKRK